MSEEGESFPVPTNRQECIRSMDVEGESAWRRKVALVSHIDDLSETSRRLWRAAFANYEERENLRASGIAKLTPSERKALGIT